MFLPWQFILGNVTYPNVVESGVTDDSITDYSNKLSYEFNDYVTVYGGIATGYRVSQLYDHDPGEL